MAYDPGISHRLRVLRKAFAMTQDDFAEFCGLKPSQYGNYEHPRGSRPSVDAAYQIVDATGVEFDWLWRGREDHMTVAKMRMIQEAEKAISRERGSGAGSGGDVPGSPKILRGV